MKLDDIVQFEGGNVGVVYYYNKFEVNRKKINRVEVKGQNHIVRGKYDIKSLTKISNTYLDYWHVISVDSGFTLKNSDEMYCKDVEGSIASFMKSEDAIKHLNSKVGNKLPKSK